MNISSFSFLLHKPGKIEDGNATELQKVIEEYPYFQPARALQLKGLKLEKSFRYNNALKVAAAYTRDRSILFEFITSKEFNQNRVANRIMQAAAGLNIEELEVEDQEEVIVKDNKTAFDFNHVDADSVMDPDLFKPKTPAEPPVKELPETSETKEEPESNPNPLKIGQPLEFNRSETHSFSEWLKLSGTINPIVREEEDKTVKAPQAQSPAPAPTDRPSALEKKLSLIDKFIENSPKIPPVSKEGPSINPVKESNTPGHALMTETLARVYLEQKKYKKAIQAYKILSLKYPEKSSLFADQIKEIKNLKDSNK